MRLEYNSVFGTSHEESNCSAFDQLMKCNGQQQPTKVNFEPLELEIGEKITAVNFQFEGINKSDFVPQFMYETTVLDFTFTNMISDYIIINGVSLDLSDDFNTDISLVSNHDTGIALHRNNYMLRKETLVNNEVKFEFQSERIYNKTDLLLFQFIQWMNVNIPAFSSYIYMLVPVFYFFFIGSVVTLFILQFYLYKKHRLRKKCQFGVIMLALILIYNGVNGFIYFLLIYPPYIGLFEVYLLFLLDTIFPEKQKESNTVMNNILPKSTGDWNDREMKEYSRKQKYKAKAHIEQLLKATLNGDKETVKSHLKILDKSKTIFPIHRMQQTTEELFIEALNNAIIGGSLETTTLICQYFSKAVPNESQCLDVLDSALCYNRPNILAYLLDYVPPMIKYINTKLSNKRTLLLRTVEEMNFNLFKVLIERGADISVRNSKNRSVLHVAVIAEANEIIVYIYKHYPPQFINLVLYENSLINHPLEIAVHYELWETATVVIKSMSVTCDLYNTEKTVLHKIYMNPELWDLERHVIKNGCPMSQMDKSGIVALHYYVEEEDYGFYIFKRFILNFTAGLNAKLLKTSRNPDGLDQTFFQSFMRFLLMDPDMSGSDYSNKGLLKVLHECGYDYSNEEIKLLADCGLETFAKEIRQPLMLQRLCANVIRTSLQPNCTVGLKKLVKSYCLPNIIERLIFMQDDLVSIYRSYLDL